MTRFTKPDTGNAARPGSPVNSVRNLARKLNRQYRDRRNDMLADLGAALAAWFAPARAA